MEKKGLPRKVGKKRGRLPKTKRLEQEDLNGNSSSTESNSTSVDKPMASKPRTRHALADSDMKATPSSQNMDERSSETLRLVKQLLFEPNSEDKANHVQVEAKGTQSDLEVPQPELPLQLASPSEKTLTNHNPPKLEVKAYSNISPNLTVQTSENPAINEVMSKPEDPMVELEGYKVKKEVTPLLRAIFEKYGDIARESIFSKESRPCLLEMVCSIHKRLEALDFVQLTPLELESMKGQIKDLELVKVNIGWLHERLNQISKAMDMDIKGSGAMDMLINEKKRAVKNCEEELQKLEVRLQQEKDELDALQICTGSLVHGLV